MPTCATAWHRVSVGRSSEQGPTTRAVRWIVATAVVIALLVWTPSASAHTEFESADPPDGATIDVPVDRIVVRFTAGAEVAGDKVLVDGADVQFSAGGRVGAKIGSNGKLFATAGYTFSDIDDPYVGAGYQHKFGSNVYGKVEYRHQFIGNFGEFDTITAGVGFAF